MKLTIKEKAKLFWDRNKTTIITLLVSAGVITGVGCAVNHYAKKAEEEKKALEAEAARKADEEAEAALQWEERIANDPENQLTGGGYVAPDRNNLNEADCPNLLANCVPLTSLGSFGEDVIKRYKEEWPDWKDVGMFNPETAVADVYVDFCHEKWLEAQRAKEAESQEKQTS